jgi:hypothetical protein
MSITEIESRYFSSTCSIQRRSTATTSTGDLTETWVTLGTNILTSVQALNVSEQSSLNQGAEYIATHKAYLPDNIVIPKNGDQLTDLETGRVYEIVSVIHYQASRNDVTVGHHYTLILNTPKDTKA